MLVCSQCGHENSDDSNFCNRCGSRTLGADASETTISYAVADEDTLAGLVLSVPSHQVPALVVRSGGGREGEQVALSSDLVTIGRTPESYLFLDDVTVSRHHARVVRDATGFAIEDQNSLNGTYVNRQRVERHHLVNGDELQVGKYKLVFLEPAEG
jgi:hypothetical protein